MLLLKSNAADSLRSFHGLWTFKNTQKNGAYKISQDIWQRGLSERGLVV